MLEGLKNGLHVEVFYPFFSLLTFSFIVLLCEEKVGSAEKWSDQDSRTETQRLMDVSVAWVKLLSHLGNSNIKIAEGVLAWSYRLP